MRINLGEDEQPEIGLIALIDCIFFLLMFFMIATSFKQQASMQSENKLSVVLPEASASLESGISAENAVSIGVDREGNLFLNGLPITIKKLQDHLRTIAELSKNTLIEIDGDETVFYKNIIRVIDLCQFEGLTNIALHIRKK